MSIYLYELPTTGAISFSDFCIDQTPTRLYTTHISDATQARANLRSELKESKRADHGEKDHLKLVKIIDEYLPLLRGIMGCVNGGEISLRSEPVFSWRTTLSANLFNASPRQLLPSLHADLASSVLTHAFALSNLARSIVTSLGWYERERRTSDDERKAKDEKLNFAVTLLCRASGIFSCISETVLLEWENDSPGDGTTRSIRPPDLNREVNVALSKMALADAQTLAIRKLLSRATFDSTVTPGPPLPRSHPSPVLIAKLHLECASLYSSALSLVQSSSQGKSRTKGKNSSSSTTQADGEVSAELRRYLSDESSFHAALAKKWLGIDLGENGGNEKSGEAVGFLTWAKKQLEELKDGGKGLSLGKEKDAKDRRREKVHEELESVTAFLRHHKKINDTLSYRPIPSQNDLQASVPGGRLAVIAQPFMLPVPGFGPGSVEYVRQRAEELEVGGDGAAVSVSSAVDARYAGAGAYF